MRRRRRRRWNQSHSYSVDFKKKISQLLWFSCVREYTFLCFLNSVQCCLQEFVCVCVCSEVLFEGEHSHSLSLFFSLEFSAYFSEKGSTQHTFSWFLHKKVDQERERERSEKGRVTQERMDNAKTSVIGCYDQQLLTTVAKRIFRNPAELGEDDTII